MERIIMEIYLCKKRKVISLCKQPDFYIRFPPSGHSLSPKRVFLFLFCTLFGILLPFFFVPLSFYFLFSNLPSASRVWYSTLSSADTKVEKKPSEYTTNNRATRK